MKYVVTGSLGHISKPLAVQLVNAGHDVTVVSSNPAKGSEIESLGAKAAIGSVEDIAFLTNTFKGADAIYTMVPPNFGAGDWIGYIRSIGNNYADAIKASGVKKVVNLSSIGAHIPEGCGPVSGIHFVELALNKLDGVDVKHLRPGFFFTNLYANIGMIQHLGIIGANYGDNTKMVMAHPNDIALVAAEELLTPSFTGKTIRYIASDEPTTNEIAKAIGAAIGKPELPWVNFKNEDALNGMMGAGLSAEIAGKYVEMGAAMASGAMTAEYANHKPELSPTKLADFAREFAAVYAQS